MSFWDFAYSLRQQGEMCDLTIHVLDANESLPAHKLILAYHSPYLCQLITGESIKEVNIPSVRNETMQLILQLLYRQTSFDELRSFTNFQDLRQALDLLQIDLKDDFLDPPQTTKLAGTQQSMIQTSGVISASEVAELDHCKNLDASKRLSDTQMENSQTFPDQNLGHPRISQVMTSFGDKSLGCGNMLDSSCDPMAMSPVSLVTSVSHANADPMSVTDRVEAASTVKIEQRGVLSSMSASVTSHDIKNVISTDIDFKSQLGETQQTGSDHSLNILNSIKDESGQGVKSENSLNSSVVLSQTEQLVLINEPTNSLSETKTLAVTVPGCSFIDSLSEASQQNTESICSSENFIKMTSKTSTDTVVLETLKGCKGDVTISDAELARTKPLSGSSDHSNQVSMAKKRKKKEISMDVLKRFCAKQAEKKKLGTSTDPENTQGSTKSEKDGRIESPSVETEKSKARSKVKQSGPITCQLCGVVSPSFSIWERHVLKHSDEKPFECEVCGKRFNRKGNLVVHKKCHSFRERKFDCKQCHAKFLTKGALKSHYDNMHINSAVSKCEHCGTVFKSVYSLKIHIETKHQFKELLSCDDCDKTFTHAIYLKRHRLTHTDELPFPCKHCPLSFRTYGARATHVSMEHTKQLFICDVCGNSYHSRSVLLAHTKRVHLNKDSSRECPICHKFVSNFYNHIRMHKSYEKGEVFTCEECGKTFPLKSYLQQHMYVHRKKRFSCSGCNKEFTFNASLQSHVKNCIHTQTSGRGAFLALHGTTDSDKPHSPVIQFSEASLENIQSTIQQPIVFKYLSNSYPSFLPKEDLTLEQIDSGKVQESTEHLEGFIASPTNSKEGVLIGEEEKMSDAAIAGTLKGIGDLSMKLVSDQEAKEIQGSLPDLEEAQNSPVMRSIRIQPGNSGKAIMIEQTAGQEFSRDQLESLVSSLGEDTLKGDVQYVCILPD